MISFKMTLIKSTLAQTSLQESTLRSIPSYSKRLKVNSRTLSWSLDCCNSLAWCYLFSWAVFITGTSPYGSHQIRINTNSCLSSLLRLNRINKNTMDYKIQQIENKKFMMLLTCSHRTCLNRNLVRLQVFPLIKHHIDIKKVMGSHHGGLIFILNLNRKLKL